MDKVFDLREIILIILRKWRVLLVLTIVFGILCGTMGGFLYYSRLRNSADEQNADLYQIKLQIYESQQANIQQEIDNLAVELEYYMDSFDKSLLSQADPYNANVSVLYFLIDTEYQVDPDLSLQTPDYCDRLARYYLILGRSSEAYAEIVSMLDLDIEPAYIQEAVTIRYEGDGIVSITGLSLYQDYSKEIVRSLYDYFLAAYPKVSTEVAYHKLVLLSESESKGYSQTLYDYKQEQIQTVRTLNDTILEQQEELNSLEKPVLSVMSKKSVLKRVVIYGVVGAVVGCGLAFIIIFYLAAVDIKIRKDSEIESMFGISYIGNIYL